MFGASLKSVARWRKTGRITGFRTPGGAWRYPADHIRTLYRAARTERL
ncbi:MerR family DNA-binding transcriptional regulator [Nocardiopsis sp. CNT-189]